MQSLSPKHSKSNTFGSILYIVQNDVSDWEGQSALMSDIYANGYLNIAATHSKDRHGGLFGERWTSSLHEIPQDRRKRSVKPHAIPFEAGGEISVRHNLANAHTDVGTRRSDIAGYDITKCSPLLTRAWAYQERLLSPRTVNFHTSEMVWDYGKGFSCECGELSWKGFLKLDVPKFIFVLPSNMETASDAMNHSYKYNMIEEFLTVKLTVATDKLPELAGVANRFRS
jgi:hypothetical protein